MKSTAPQPPPPLQAGREFATTCVAHLLGGRFHLPGAHLPAGSHTVARDFAGIGVATCPDPAHDDYVLDALGELGVRQVRLDYTYDSPGSHAERLLGRLVDASFDVLLHLVPPPAAAREMPAADACARWRAFLAETFECWGEHVTMYEVGSTVNRRRWAGYDLSGWLAAWQIACEEIRQRDLLLLGPNVTDFEPYFNDALLTMLAKRGLLPDIHTNNLFVERAGEPEAWDHKSLGERGAPLLKLNVVRKAKTLHAVAKRHGVETTYSTNAYWTTQRITRYLAESEQKQADYLTRYMVLTAASGALRRVYWGPMIGYNDGLIDDGTEDLPDTPRAAFYGETRGELSQYRKRLAFEALRQFQRTIPGCTYHGPAATGHGLEIHRFSSEREHVHVVWTQNGRCAELASCYRPDDLESARIHTRDGGSLPERPELVTESPLYLSWPVDAEIAVSAHARAMDDVSIAAHRPGGFYYHRCDGKWRGMVFAANRSEADRLFESLHPERIGAQPERASLRKSRNAIWTIADPRDPERQLAVKQPARLAVNKKLLDRFKPSKARRSWNGACELLRRGVPTPAPVAWFERADRVDLVRNWYFCEFMEGDLSVRRAFSAFSAGKSHYHGVPQDEFFRQLRQVLLRMHRRGAYFRDLTGGNVLVRIGDDGRPEFTLIDTNRARFRRRETPMRERLSDLKRVCRKLDWSRRARFMNMYLDCERKGFTFFHRLPFYLYDVKAEVKSFLRARARRRAANGGQASPGAAAEEGDTTLEQARGSGKAR